VGPIPLIFLFQIVLTFFLRIGALAWIGSWKAESLM